MSRTLSRFAYHRSFPAPFSSFLSSPDRSVSWLSFEIPNARNGQVFAEISPLGRSTVAVSFRSCRFESGRYTLLIQLFFQFIRYDIRSCVHRRKSTLPSDTVTLVRVPRGRLQHGAQNYSDSPLLLAVKIDAPAFTANHFLRPATP